MADYQPLIQRAIAGLDRNTGEARRALYERARTALVAQLRGVKPPLQEAEITRERLALEEAIRKVEAEAARRTRVDAPAAPVAPPQSAPRFPNATPAAPNRPARPPAPAGTRRTGRPPRPPMPSGARSRCQAAAVAPPPKFPSGSAASAGPGWRCAGRRPRRRPARARARRAIRSRTFRARMISIA